MGLGVEIPTCASITSKGVKKLAEIAEKGHLKVFINPVFKMEDVLAVCSFTSVQGFDPS